MRGRGTGGAWHAEQLRCREDLRFRQLARLRPPTPSNTDRANPRPDPAGSRSVCKESCPDALPLGGRSQQPFPVRWPRLQHPDHPLHPIF